MIGMEQGITPSGLVYLFGEQFVEPARAFGEDLLYSGVRIKARELAEMLYAAALSGLEADGTVRLELATRKRLLGLAKAQTVAVTPLTRAEPGGLEASILACLSADPARNDVPDLLHRHLGRDMQDPWGYITQLVKRDLAARGFLREERTQRSGLGALLGDKVTLNAVPERIAPLATQAGQVRDLLHGFRSQRADVAAQLWKDLRAGFQRRVEKPDTDTD